MGKKFWSEGLKLNYEKIENQEIKTEDGVVYNKHNQRFSSKLSYDGRKNFHNILKVFPRAKGIKTS